MNKGRMNYAVKPINDSYDDLSGRTLTFVDSC